MTVGGGACQSAIISINKGPSPDRASPTRRAETDAPVDHALHNQEFYKHIKAAKTGQKLAQTWSFKQSSSMSLTTSTIPNQHLPNQIKSKCLAGSPRNSPAKLVSPEQPLLTQEIQTDSLAAEPMIPFYAAGLIVLYAVNAGANTMMGCE